MIEFDKWFAQITKEYPMYQDGEGYNIGNTRALMVGWRAALRWVLKKGKPYYDINDEKVVATDSDVIYKELEE